LRRLPLIAANGSASFQAVAGLASRGDLHYRAILEELVRLGMVNEDSDTGMAQLVSDEFVPKADLQSMLAFGGDNGQDHLLAGVANVLQRLPSMLEDAVHAQGLTLQQCEQLQHKARERWARLHHELVGAMTRAVDDAPEDATARIRVGIYTYFHNDGDDQGGASSSSSSA